MKAGNIKVIGLILAGGQARRFGQNKCLQELKGRPLILWVHAVLKEVCDEVWLSLRDQEQTRIYQHLLGVKFTLDPYPGQGPLAAVAHAAQELSPADLLLVTACDQPLLRPTLLSLLVEKGLKSRAEGVFCTDNQGNLWPFPALFRKGLFKGVEERDLREKSFREFLATKKILRLPPSLWKRADPLAQSFFNINYPKDLDKAQEFLKGADF